jgi:hypothetical protein
MNESPAAAALLPLLFSATWPHSRVTIKFVQSTLPHSSTVTIALMLLVMLSICATNLAVLELVQSEIKSAFPNLKISTTSPA